jgi:titin
VTASNGGGESAPSNTASVTTPAPPAAPSNLAATAVSGTQVNLTWADNSTNETGFRIYQSTDGVNYASFATVGANVTAYSWTGAVPGASYSWRVTAYNAAGESAASNTATVTTPGAPPAAPSGLSATAAANGTQVDLTWADNSNNETGFRVYQSADGVSYALLATVGPNVTAYSWAGASPGTAYSFRVTAYNAAGESATSNTATVTTPAAPAAPSNLAATAVSGTQVSLTWADNSANETGFWVYQSADGVNYTLLASVGADVTGYTWSGAAPGTTYSFRVTAYNAVAESAASNTATVTTPTPPAPPAAPSNLVARAVSNTRISLTWADNSNNETGFTIEMSTDGVNYTQVATVGPNVTGYTATGLLPLTTYYFRVRAYNAAGNSAYSNVASATTPLL